MHDHSPSRAPSHAKTLHARIRGELAAKILSGEWPVGTRIPPEHELSAQYACSRMTVNKAVSALVADGLITRNRRAGSFVARPRMHAAVLHIPDIQQEVAARGAAYGYACIKVEHRAACCTYLGEEGHLLGPSLFIRSLHSSDGVPLLLEDRHIFLNAVPDAEGVDFTTTPPGSWLLGHVPWTEAEHRISADIADAGAARALAIPPGSACLVVDRRTWRGAATLTRVRQVFRGDAYHLVARFAPSQG